MQILDNGRIVKIGDPYQNGKTNKLCLWSIVIKRFSHKFLLFGLRKRGRQSNREESGNDFLFIVFFFISQKFR